MKIIQMSDIHLGGNGKTEEARLFRMIEELKQDYDLSQYVILITGDLVDDPKGVCHWETGQIGIAHAFIGMLKKLAKKVLIAPGNHDYYTWNGNGFYYDKESVEIFNANILGWVAVDFPIVTHFEDTVFIGLNTAHPSFFATGKLGSKQRNKLDKMLEKYKNDETIIYMHHHPYMVKSGGNFIYEKAMELMDSEEFMEIIDHRVNYVFFGHRHSWAGKVEHNGAYFVNCGSTGGKGSERGVMIVDTERNTSLYRTFGRKK